MRQPVSKRKGGGGRTGQVGRPPDRNPHTLAEYQEALAELHVVEEELRQQNEELAETRLRLEAERARYRDLFESAPDGYLITDAVGKIAEANRAAGGLLRIAPAFLVGKPLASFVPMEDRALFRTRLNHLQQRPGRQEWEIRLCPRHGNAFFAVVTVDVVRETSGMVTGLRWLLRDFTERKRDEELRRRADALVEADRLKSALLAVVSHDLKTPLAAIKVSISSLQRRLAPLPLPEGTVEALDGIEEEADRLNTLVSDLLDLSRLQSGAWQPAREWYELADILGTVLPRFGADDAARIRVCLPEDLPMLWVDGVQIAQVLWNLLSNALKYSTPPATVEVSAACDSAGEAAGDRECVLVTVADHGIGIAEAERTRVFEPFFRCGRETHSDGQVRLDPPGSGLGLAICHSLVEAHAGNIWVAPAPDGGSRFQFTLPVAEPACPPAAGDESEMGGIRHDPPDPGGR